MTSFGRVAMVQNFASLSPGSTVASAARQIGDGYGVLIGQGGQALNVLHSGYLATLSPGSRLYDISLAPLHLICIPEAADYVDVTGFIPMVAAGTKLSAIVVTDHKLQPRGIFPAEALRALFDTAGSGGGFRLSQTGTSDIYGPIAMGTATVRPREYECPNCHETRSIVLYEPSDPPRCLKCGCVLIKVAGELAVRAAGAKPARLPAKPKTFKRG